ncbi:MAG: tRNA glutamyl-Q(34) synthetase GluQRS [Ottowia sp.]|nr:tRNA glutamyl-Q(34) synthetase GluQRS [Ottowia sp.]
MNAAALSVPVVGRFAPSPSGSLHFGSLIAAVGSFLQARAQGGQWRLRIDDLDAPRTRAGAETDILRTLEAFGFAWDGAIARQSDAASQARYQAAFAQLQQAGAVYGCACTRRDLTDAPRARDGARRYPGTCRAGLPAGVAARAFRVRVHGEVEFLDGIQGRQTENLAEDCGDFIIARADGVFAYQLAVVLDDAAQGVTEVVRGADLLATTGRQIFLHHLLGLPVPVYAHLPLALDAAGAKLSKQTLAQPLDARRAPEQLAAALAFLGHPPPTEVCRAPVRELWAWALPHWTLARVPRRAAIAPEWSLSSKDGQVAQRP